MGDEESAEDSEGSLDLEKPGGEIRRNILKVVAENPGIEGKAVYEDYLDNEDSEYYIRGGTSDTAVYNQIDRLERNGLVEKRSDGKSKPLFLTDTGRVTCKEEGISLPRDYPGIFIDTLEELLEPGYLDSEKREKIKNNWPEGFLRTVNRINSTYPLTGLDQSRGVLGEVLRATWVFEVQKLDASTSGKVETIDSKLEPEKLEGEGYNALTIALENEHFAYLESLCDLLEELTPASPQLAEIRDAVKSAYREQVSEGVLPKGEEVPPEVEKEILKEHSEEMRRELRNMKEWIEETDVRANTSKSMTHSKYGPKDGKIYGHLTEHLPKLIENFKEFQGKLNSQNPLVRTFSWLLDDKSDISALKVCYSSVDWKKDIDALVNCLEEKGLKLSKDRDLWRKSGGNLVASEGTSVEERLKNLGRLIDLTFELEEEKTRIADELDKNTRKMIIPGKCEWVREQFEGYGS